MSTFLFVSAPGRSSLIVTPANPILQPVTAVPKTPLLLRSPTLVARPPAAATRPPPVVEILRSRSTTPTEPVPRLSPDTRPTMSDVMSTVRPDSSLVSTRGPTRPPRPSARRSVMPRALRPTVCKTETSATAVVSRRPILCPTTSAAQTVPVTPTKSVVDGTGCQSLES